MIMIYRLFLFVLFTGSLALAQVPVSVSGYRKPLPSSHPMANAQPAVTVAPSVSPMAAPVALQSGDQIFANAKNSVYKLSIYLKTANSERGHGSAFAVRADGYLITNFHVVSDVVGDPEKYQMMLETPQGSVPAEVVAIDAVNDISLVHVAQSLPAFLPVAPANGLPKVGETIYSIGFPRSEEITVIQGTFNGLHVFGFAPVTAASMPLNPGMSGGPTLNSYGQVVGVNRAMMVAAQNISYLSPLAALNTIVAQARAGTTHQAWAEEIKLQIEAQERVAMSVNSRMPAHREKIGSTSFAVAIPGVKCGQDELAPKSEKNKSQFLSCQTLSLALVSHETNALQVNTIIIQDPKPTGALQPFGQMQSKYDTAKKALQETSTHEEEKRNVASLPPLSKGKEKCGVRNVINEDGVKLLVRYCRLPVKDVPGIYNTFVKIDMSGPKGAKTSFAQSYEGLSVATTADLLQKFLDSIRVENVE